MGKLVSILKKIEQIVSTLELLHEYDPHPQPLSQNGRGEPELALLPSWDKGWDEGEEIDARSLV
jgi:hypothetical protein